MTDDLRKTVAAQAAPARTRWCRDDWQMHATCARFKAGATRCICDCHKPVKGKALRGEA